MRASSHGAVLCALERCVLRTLVPGVETAPAAAGRSDPRLAAGAPRLGFVHSLLWRLGGSRYTAIVLASIHEASRKTAREARKHHSGARFTGCHRLLLVSQQQRPARRARGAPAHLCHARSHHECGPSRHSPNQKPQPQGTGRRGTPVIADASRWSACLLSWCSPLGVTERFAPASRA